MREVAPGDMWTDVFTAPGKRTTGTAGQAFAIVGPDWHGSLPEGIERYDSPTAAGVPTGRTQTNGKADYNNVHKFKDGVKAVPLSAYGRPYAPPTGAVNANQDMSAPPDQVDKMDAARFSGCLSSQRSRRGRRHAQDRLRKLGG